MSRVTSLQMSDSQLVSPLTIPQGNVGAMVRALIKHWDEEGGADWTDRSCDLKPG